MNPAFIWLIMLQVREVSNISAANPWPNFKQPLQRMQDGIFSVKVPKVYEDFYLMSTPLGSSFWQHSQK